MLLSNKQVTHMVPFDFETDRRSKQRLETKQLSRQHSDTLSLNYSEKENFACKAPAKRPLVQRSSKRKQWSPREPSNNKR